MLKGLLTKLGLAPPEVDPLGRDLALHSARRALLAGDAKPLAAHLDPKRLPDGRALALRILNELDPRPPALDAWLRAEPRSPLALLARGTHGIGWAWCARGNGYANTVTAERNRLFRTRLGAARKDLEQAAALDPRDPEPHAQLVTVGLGENLPLAAIRASFDAAIERAPDHHEVHHSFLQASSAKWHGSDQAALDHALAASARAPAGSALHDLVPAAHVEAWLQIRSSPQPAGHRNYWFRPAVQKDLSAAWSRSGGRFEGPCAGEAEASSSGSPVARRTARGNFGEPGKAFLEAEKGVLYA